MPKIPIIVHIEPLYTITLPGGTTTAIKVGDLLSWDGTEVVPVSAATDDATFVGVAFGKSAATAIKQIPIYTKCIIDIELIAAAYTLGQSLTWSSADILVDGVANTLAWFWEADLTAVAGTLYKVLIEVNALAKQSGVVNA